jgi:hypothetical protein
LCNKALLPLPSDLEGRKKERQTKAIDQKINVLTKLSSEKLKAEVESQTFNCKTVNAL